jgi:hypothetical protein
VRKFFLILLALIPLAVYAGSYSSRSFSSSRSYSSPSRSYSSSSYRSMPSPAKSYSSPSYKSAPAPKPYSSPTYAYKAPVTPSARPLYSPYSRPAVVEHHYYGGSPGFGSGNFWFWMWAFNSGHQQPVYMNAAGAPGGSSGTYAAPSTFDSALVVVLNVLIFAAVLGGLIWMSIWLWRWHREA